MGFNSRLLLYLGGILLTMLLLSFSLLNTDYYATILVLLLFLLLQIASLFRHIRSSNRELLRFLEALEYADFSQSFPVCAGRGSQAQVRQALNDAMQSYQTLHRKQEQQSAYLQAFTQHLPIAVLAVDGDQRVVYSNTALLHLLGRSSAPVDLESLKAIDAALGEAIETLKPGGEATLVLSRHDVWDNVKLSCTAFSTSGRQQKLVTIQNIESELQAKELEAWQNLIRVMTHEIMNSITPITSLSDSAGHYVQESRQLVTALDNQESKGSLAALLEDAADALSTISKRGQALMCFVENFRLLSRLPTPKPVPIELEQILHSVKTLMGRQLQMAGVELKLYCQPRTLQLMIDPAQLEQSLINLLRNALDAVAGRALKRIELSAAQAEDGHVTITLSDNGAGISEQNLESIFVPFFTTKRGGSGIGMSIVKQIVQANGGRISVNSQVDKGTTIRLVFRGY